MTPEEQLDKLRSIQKSLAGLKGKPRALIVDDDWKDAELMGHRLKEHGVEFDAVAYGERAIEKLAENSYWVVFLDWKLRGMSGLDTLRAIKALPSENNVIIITGLPCGDITTDALSNGAAAVMSKTFEDEHIKFLFSSAT
jgi:DNA-binding response OmpR family regulator